MNKKYYLAYFIILAIVILVWEHQANDNTIRVLISKPSLISKYLIKESTQLLRATWITFIESFSGLLIATIFSFGTMIFCFYFPRLIDFILPIFIVSQVIPLITLAPLFIILFGAGLTAKIMMAALLCYFPIFVNFANGVKLINKNIRELLYIYNATTLSRMKHAYFPLTLPNIMTGLKIAATLSVIGAIVAEFNGAEVGLGKNLFLAAKRLEPELMMSSLLLSSLLGGALYLLIFIIEKTFGRWYLNGIQES